MEVAIKKTPKVRISYDEMEAYLLLPTPILNQDYVFEDILELVHNSNVREGIDEEKIAAMINEKYYDRECLIAKGVSAVNGVDAYYEYNFDVNFTKRPTRREDGTVDFWSIHAVEIVKEGQVLAVYHEPVEGTDGISVKGKKLIAKRGRPLQPLTGKGFARSEDNITYTSLMDGKIEMQKNRIMISNVHEIFSDVGPETGNVDFLGDVIIHGNVPTGYIVKATGSITIDGTVEGCFLDANKDIIIRGGMLGANRGTIRTRGNLYAKFLQYADVKAEGSIETDSAIGCKLVCNDMLHMQGKYASIIGGVVHAANGVECTDFGNKLGVKTEVYVGVNKELKRQIKYLEDGLKEAQDVLDKLEIGIKQLDKLAKHTGMDLSNDPRRVSLVRTKIVKQADISTYNHQLKRLGDIVESAKDASVKAVRHVYSGVVVGVNEALVQVKEEQESVTFLERTGNVVMFSMKDELVG